MTTQTPVGLSTRHTWCNAKDALRRGGDRLGDLARRLAVIERAAGASSSVARSTAVAILAECDTALEGQIEVEPPAMPLATFQAHLAAVVRQLETLRDSTSVQTAA